MVLDTEIKFWESIVFAVSYLLHYDTLLQNARDVITKCGRYFITKCNVYYKMGRYRHSSLFNNAHLC